MWYYIALPILPILPTLHIPSRQCGYERSALASFQAATSSVLESTQAQSRRVISKLSRAAESPEHFRLFAIYQDDL